MGGHIIDQPLPNNEMQQLDPFLLIHHAQWSYSGGQRARELGVDPHPHRGFSPVTFIYEGELRHQDSFGNDAVVGKNGTQWMHAGKGIIHSERPSEAFAEAGGNLEFIQFWVNTPAAYKMEAPYYLPLSEKETPVINKEGYSIQVVAGTYDDIIGPAKTFSPMTLLRCSVDKGYSLELSLPEKYNTLIYLLDGLLVVNGKEISGKQLVSFAQDGVGVKVDSKETTRFIVLSGEPIDEKVTSYGPFVMNNQTEILQALRDAQMGKMGVLIES